MLAYPIKVLASVGQSVIGAKLSLSGNERAYLTSVARDSSGPFTNLLSLVCGWRRVGFNCDTRRPTCALAHFGAFCLNFTVPVSSLEANEEKVFNSSKCSSKSPTGFFIGSRWEAFEQWIPSGACGRVQSECQNDSGSRQGICGRW